MKRPADHGGECWRLVWLGVGVGGCGLVLGVTSRGGCGA